MSSITLDSATLKFVLVTLFEIAGWISFFGTVKKKHPINLSIPHQELWRFISFLSMAACMLPIKYLLENEVPVIVELVWASIPFLVISWWLYFHYKSSAFVSKKVVIYEAKEREKKEKIEKPIEKIRNAIIGLHMGLTTFAILVISIMPREILPWNVVIVVAVVVLAGLSSAPLIELYLAENDVLGITRTLKYVLVLFIYATIALFFFVITELGMYFSNKLQMLGILSTSAFSIFAVLWLFEKHLEKVMAGIDDPNSRKSIANAYLKFYKYSTLFTIGWLISLSDAPIFLGFTLSQDWTIMILWAGGISPFLLRSVDSWNSERTRIRFKLGLQTIDELGKEAEKDEAHLQGYTAGEVFFHLFIIMFFFSVGGLIGLGLSWKLFQMKIIPEYDWSYSSIFAILIAMIAWIYITKKK